MMTMTKKQIAVLQNYLKDLFPNASCELIYSKDYELVIAVMLSAQTSDAKVNGVVSRLFSVYPDLSSLASAKVEDIEDIIRPLGLYRNKSKNIIGIATKLINDFNGVVPSDKKLLTTLPGIGNKSAGVIRSEIFHIPDFPVDTHILRISKRLKIRAEKDGPDETEKKLKKIFPSSSWIKLHHQLIHFGRYVCTAFKPQCEKCKLREFCQKK